MITLYEILSKRKQYTLMTQKTKKDSEWCTSAYTGLYTLVCGKTPPWGEMAFIDLLRRLT